MQETAAMNPLILPTSETENQVEQIVVSLHAQRGRAGKFLDAHLTRLERVEEALESHLRQLQEDSNALSKTPSKSDANDDYQRRYEMALDDLRDLKVKHADLQFQLNEARAKMKYAPAVAQSNGRCLDWEAEKNRILALLEADFDDNDPQQHAERLKIEDAIQSTENVITEKDREIEELRRRLDEYDGNDSCEAERSATLKQAVDADDAIKQNRQQLEDLKKQWQEKFRQAEIELSTERAKLARREAELNERVKAISADSPTQNDSDDKSNQSAQSPGKHWLSRLGLTEADWTYRKRR